MVGGGVKQVAQRFNIEHLVPFLVNVSKANAGDYIIFDEKGVIPFLGFTFNYSAEGAINYEERFNYGYAQINQEGITTATTTITITAGTFDRKTPYYIMTGGNEIIEVVSETAPEADDSVWTVRRGALGSTPSITGLDIENWVSILNILVLSSDYTGYDLALVMALPQDSGDSCF